MGYNDKMATAESVLTETYFLYSFCIFVDFSLYLYVCGEFT